MPASCPSLDPRNNYAACFTALLRLGGSTAARQASAGISVISWPTLGMLAECTGFAVARARIRRWNLITNFERRALLVYDDGLCCCARRGLEVESNLGFPRDDVVDLA